MEFIVDLPRKIKDGPYIINLDEYADVGTHLIAFYVLDIETIQFDSFGVEHVPEEIFKIIGNKNIKTTIFRIQANGSIMCQYFCNGIIYYTLPGRNLSQCISLF